MQKNLFLYLLIASILFSFANCEPGNNTSDVLLLKQVDSLENLLNICREKQETQLSGPQATVTLRDGLTHSNVKESLLDHTDLISKDPVLGGKMHFNRESVIILNNHWVYATFEDGHILGEGIFAFESENGKISWEVVTTNML